METRSNSKKGMSLLILGFIILCLFTGFSHAIDYEYENTGHNWVYTYDGPVHNDDIANSIAAYGGNIYTAGYHRDNVDELVVISHNAVTGDTNWVYVHEIDQISRANSIVIGRQGANRYIYVAGYQNYYSGKHPLVIKLNLTGDTVWTYMSSDVGEFLSIAYGLGVDRNIYAAGYTTNGSGKDFILISLDNAGNERWVEKYAGPGDDQANSVFARKIGAVYDIYVAGYITNISDNKDFVVMAYDTSGIQKWFYQKDGEGHGDDEARSVSALSGFAYTRVFAAGYLTGDGTGKDFFVVSLEQDNGNEYWPYIYDQQNGDDEAYSVVRIGVGENNYAAGYSTGSGTGKDFTVIKLDENGVGTTKRYNGPGNSDDEARAIVCADDKFYAAGYSTGNGTGKDFTVLKSEVGGLNAWIYRFDGSNNSNDEAGAIVCPDDGSIYAAGYSTGTGTGKDFTTISLPEDFPPTMPLLISPADSGFVNDTTVTFIWHASEDPETSIQDYWLQRDEDSLFASPTNVVVVDTSYIDTLSDTTYYWRVKARDDQQKESDWSKVWSFAFDLITPDIPTPISPIADAFVLDTSVTFDWGDVLFKDFPTLIHYVIQIDTDEAFPAPIIDDTMTASTANYNLAGDGRYYWRIKAYDLASNESPYSDVESFRLDITPPSIESTTVWNDTSFTGPFSVYSKVTDLFGLDSIMLVYCKPMEHPSWFPLDMTGTYPWFFEEIPGVTMANDTVQYYIYVRDNAGRVSTDLHGAPTDYYWFIGGYDLGVTEFDNPPTVFSFGLKNNPTRGSALFNLALPEAASVTLKIYDVSGRLIDKVISGKKSAGYYEIPWTKDVNSGIFFYHLDSPWQQKIGKLILLK